MRAMNLFLSSIVQFVRDIVTVYSLIDLGSSKAEQRDILEQSYG